MESLASGIAAVTIQDQLTDMQRKVRDNCLEYRRLIDMWDKLYNKGFSKLKKMSVLIAREIYNDKTATRASMFPVYGYRRSDRDDSDSEDDAVLEIIFKKFRDISAGMSSVVEEMKRITQDLKSIAETAQLQAEMEGNGNADHVICFKTWPVKKFYDITREATDAYIENLHGKSSYFRTFNQYFGLRSAWVLAVNVMTWFMWPSISLDLDDDLRENMLVECGINCYTPKY